MNRNELFRFLQPSLVNFLDQPDHPEKLRWYDETGAVRKQPLDFNQLLRAWRKRHPEQDAKTSRELVKSQSLAGVSDQQLWAQLPIAAVDATIFRMRQCIEEHGLEVLQRYPADLYVHDRNLLLQYWAPGMVLAWTVTDSSTHLAPIGVHPARQDIEVTVAQARHQHYFKIVVGLTTAEVKEVSEDAFRSLLRTPIPFKYRNGELCRGYDSNVLGAIHVSDPVYQAGGRRSSVTVTVRPTSYCSPQDQVALWVWANQLPIELAGSLWARWDLVWLENAMQEAA